MNAMNEQKKNFKLNEEAKHKINDEYINPTHGAPQGYPQGQGSGHGQYGRPARPVRPVRPTNQPRPADPAPPPRRVPPRDPQCIPAYAEPQYYPPEEDYGYGEEPQPPKKKKHRLRKLMVGLTILSVFVILLNIAFFFFRGQIWFNEPRKRDYPVRGAAIDQSLGKINWEIMSQQTISFMYVRATKGTSFVDEQYEQNRKNARKQDLLVGCWHEFDFRTDGQKQAEHFIEECGDMHGMLRPMVKLTKYGIYNLKMKDAEAVRDNLAAFLDTLEDYYGRKPVIMCDAACYKKYVQPYFSKYTLWTIDHFGKPDEEGWAMWEFNPRVRTEGYENSKEYFAMSVYREGKELDNFKKNLLMI